MGYAALQANLSELYAAATDRRPAMALVADLSGKRLFQKHKGWGRAWTWFYDAAYILFGWNPRSEKLDRALRATNALYAAKQRQVQEDIKALNGYLESGQKRPHRAAAGISAWNRATMPFCKLLKQDNQKLNCFLKTHFAPNDTPFAAVKESGEAKRIQAVIDLEGILHAPFPFTLLQKAATGKSCDKNETQRLRRWTYALNTREKRLGVARLHRALQAIVSRLPATHYPHPPNLVRLELKLIDHGLQHFFRGDNRHLAWREALQPGDVINLAGKTLVLGEPIGRKKEGGDGNYVFALKDDPTQVAVIGLNRAILPLKEEVAREDAWGIRHATINAIDRKGRFALIEKLEGPVSEMRWATTKGWVHPQDKDVLKPLASWVGWLLKQNACPHQLSAKHLMFDTKGRLRYAKAGLAAPFDFLTLEKFLYDCAQGNRAIFCYLMNNSGLYDHPYQKYFEEVVERTISGETVDAPALAAIAKISSAAVADSGKKLAEEILAVIETCLEKVYNEYAVPADLDPKEELKLKIYAHYKQTRAVAFLWPGIVEEVSALAAKTMQLAPRAPEAPAAEAPIDC